MFFVQVPLIILPQCSTERDLEAEPHRFLCCFLAEELFQVLRWRTFSSCHHEYSCFLCSCHCSSMMILLLQHNCVVFLNCACASDGGTFTCEEKHEEDLVEKRGQMWSQRELGDNLHFILGLLLDQLVLRWTWRNCSCMEEGEHAAVNGSSSSN